MEISNLQTKKEWLDDVNIRLNEILYIYNDIRSLHTNTIKLYNVLENSPPETTKMRQLRKELENFSKLLLDYKNDDDGDIEYMEKKFKEIGREALEMEWQFNKDAGFTEDDDEMPNFFFEEALAPSGKKHRHTSADVNKHLKVLINA